MRALLRRSLLAAVLAAVLVAALSMLLSRGEREESSRRATRRSASPGAVAEFFLPDSVPRGDAWVLYIAAPGVELPARVVPVAVIGADGTVRVSRGAPPPEGPEAAPWWAAGIVLPTPRLRDLDPGARAALVGLLRSWRGSLGIGTDRRAVTWGVEDPEELEVLSRWEW